MSISVSGTGPYTVPSSSVSGVHSQYGYATYSYFSGQVTCQDSYQAVGDASVLDFGVPLSEIVIINNGLASLVFQWKEAIGMSVDHGIVFPGSTVVLRKTYKRGMQLRCGDSGQTTSAFVWGI